MRLTLTAWVLESQAALCYMSGWDGKQGCQSLRQSCVMCQDVCDSKSVIVSDTAVLCVRLGWTAGVSVFVRQLSVMCDAGLDSRSVTASDSALLCVRLGLIAGVTDSQAWLDSKSVRISERDVLCVRVSGSAVICIKMCLTVRVSECQAALCYLSGWALQQMCPILQLSCVLSGSFNVLNGRQRDSLYPECLWCPN
jgi:hypothetical protein